MVPPAQRFQYKQPGLCLLGNSLSFRRGAQARKCEKPCARPLGGGEGVGAQAKHCGTSLLRIPEFSPTTSTNSQIPVKRLPCAKRCTGPEHSLHLRETDELVVAKDGGPVPSLGLQDSLCCSLALLVLRQRPPLLTELRHETRRCNAPHCSSDQGH